MACLENGTTLLNNNLSSFKHSIMKYDETHQNMWTSTAQINSFLNKNCQVPFRNNYAKEKTQSDNIVNDEEDRNSVTIPTTKEPPDDSEDSSSTNGSSKDYYLELEKNWKKNASRLDKVDKQSLSESEMTAVYQSETGEPSHHARRPMNAFLIFCKRHRTVVKNRYPHLENRAVTKILGEWWAALDAEEKVSYTELAKQYKNAFFSANPNFKWYKLPAPPLRTLNTRPGNMGKSPSPTSSPKSSPIREMEEKPQQLFTPGKLADETQLGSLTSLINSDSQRNYFGKNAISKQKEQSEQLPENECKDFLNSTPTDTVKLCQPSKPFKKRMFNNSHNNKNIVRNIFHTEQKADTNIFDNSLLDEALENFVDTVKNEDIDDYDDNTSQQFVNNSNFTQQEIINKVVDRMCFSKDESINEDNEDSEDTQDQKETRKSVRSCKGLRYAKFMEEGKLFVNKRAKNKTAKPYSYSDKVPRQAESIELSETIKKLAERTLGKTPKTSSLIMDLNDNDSEASQETKLFRAADFNLDEKIEALPSLSLEKFQQKKKEGKKRKFARPNKIKEPLKKKPSQKQKQESVTGSRKRKPGKQSITRLEPDQPNSSAEMDLFALATLAEVAAKKPKIDQK